MARRKHSASTPPQKKISVQVEESPDSSRSLGDEDSYSIAGSDTQASGTVDPGIKEKSAPQKFSQLFKNTSLEDCKLEEFQSVDGPVSFVDEDLAEIDDVWSHSLIGGFSDKFPGLKAIKTLVDSWKIPCKIYPHLDAWVLLKFENEQDLEKVLFGGPYTVFKRAFFLQKLPKYFNFCNVNWTVPVWVRLPGLPLDCWHPRALGKIASKLGKPISTDRMTLLKKCISFARILVEVDASTEMPSRIPLMFPNGQIIEQPVVFEHTPKYCKSCFHFGHLQANCAAALKISAPSKTIKESSGAVPTDLVSPKTINEGNANAPPETVRHSDTIPTGNKGLISNPPSRSNLVGSRVDPLPSISVGEFVCSPSNNLDVASLANVPTVNTVLPDAINSVIDLVPSLHVRDNLPVADVVADSAPEDGNAPFSLVVSNKKKKKGKQVVMESEKAAKPCNSSLLGPGGKRPHIRGNGGRRPSH